jgi:hypothetical protein
VRSLWLKVRILILPLLLLCASSIHAQTPEARDKALERAMKLLECVNKCVVVFDELEMQLKALIKKNLVQFGSLNGNDLAVCYGEGEVTINGQDYDSWERDTLNAIDIRNDFGTGNPKTHWLSDQYGNGQASDAALAAVLVHEASHSCYDNWWGDLSNDAFPSNLDRKAYHLGEARGATYEIWFLLSVLGGGWHLCAEGLPGSSADC